ncbi:hypothetical protein QJQ45_029498 [Haematococcus lacustris]|nr:hypothetical protein QJQ45_029498 [Haematococcus lacustris]
MLVHCLGRLHYDDPPTPLVYSTLALHSLRHKLPLSLISNVLWAYGQLATSNVLFAQSLSTPAMCTLVLAAEQQLREARQKLGDLGLAVGLSEPKRVRVAGEGMDEEGVEIHGGEQQQQQQQQQQHTPPSQSLSQAGQTGQAGYEGTQKGSRASTLRSGGQEVGSTADKQHAWFGPQGAAARVVGVGVAARGGAAAGDRPGDPAAERMSATWRWPPPPPPKLELLFPATGARTVCPATFSDTLDYTRFTTIPLPRLPQPLPHPPGTQGAAGRHEEEAEAGAVWHIDRPGGCSSSVLVPVTVPEDAGEDRPGGLVTVLLDFVRGVAEQATTSDSQVIGNVARACMRLRLKSPELLTCISQLLPGLLPQLTDQDIGSVATSCACLYSGPVSRSVVEALGSELARRGLDQVSEQSIMNVASAHTIMDTAGSLEFRKMVLFMLQRWQQQQWRPLSSPGMKYKSFQLKNFFMASGVFSSNVVTSKVVQQC